MGFEGVALTEGDLLFEGASGPPWGLSCSVVRVGGDTVCRLHGGDWHVGAVALAQWRESGPLIECLVVGPHKERAIAEHAADTLCRATRRPVVCIAGIHFDGISKDDIAVISRDAHRLAERAARHLTSGPPPGAAIP
jgi:gallate decarboxylase subunit D